MCYSNYINEKVVELFPWTTVFDGDDIWCPSPSKLKFYSGRKPNKGATNWSPSGATGWRTPCVWHSGDTAAPNALEFSYQQEWITLGGEGEAAGSGSLEPGEKGR